MIRQSHENVAIHETKVRVWKEHAPDWTACRVAVLRPGQPYPRVNMFCNKLDDGRICLENTVV